MNSVLQHYVLKKHNISASSMMAKQYVVACILACFIVFFVSNENWDGLQWFQQAPWSVRGNFMGDECMSYLGLVCIMALTKHSGSVVTHSGACSFSMIVLTTMKYLYMSILPISTFS